MLVNTHVVWYSKITEALWYYKMPYVIYQGKIQRSTMVQQYVPNQYSMITSTATVWNGRINPGSRVLKDIQRQCGMLGYKETVWYGRMQPMVCHRKEKVQETILPIILYCSTIQIFRTHLKIIFFNFYQSQFRFEVIHNPIVRVKIVFLKYGLGVSIQISGCGQKFNKSLLNLNSQKGEKIKNLPRQPIFNNIQI